ncbi:cupin, partial [Pseudomonas sp. CM25]|nr:cupin [Pseudomonas sp. CM25]
MFAIDSSTQPMQALRFEDDGATPNSRFPVLLYRLQRVEPAHDN